MIKNIKNLSKDKKRLVSNFFSLSILQAFTYILPLITLPYLVRVLGVEKFGLVVFAQSFIMFFNILVDFGFDLSATREVSIHRNNKEKIIEIFSSVMIIKFILLTVSFAILSIMVFSINKFSSDWELYYLTYLWVIGQAMFPIWYFQGMEKMKYITIVNISSKLLFTLLIFVVIKEPNDYIYVPAVNGFGFMIGGLASLWMIHRNFSQSFVLQNIGTLKKYFFDSSQFFLSRVSVSIYTSANAFVLGLFLNNTMVGYYSIAEKLYQALQGVYGPINQALYPYVARERNIKLFKKLFSGIVIVNTLGIAILYFIGPFIFDLLFTQHIGSESVRVLNILLLAALVVVPSILIGYPFLGALGFAKYANWSVVYGSIFHIIGLGVLVISGNISIFSVAFMVVATEILVLMYRIYGIRINKLWQKQ